MTFAPKEGDSFASFSSTSSSCSSVSSSPSHKMIASAKRNRFIRRNCYVTQFDDGGEAETEVFIRAKNRMRVKHVARIAIAHLILYICVLLYIMVGAYLFHIMEGEREIELQGYQRGNVTALKAGLIHFINNYQENNKRSLAEIDEFLNDYFKSISKMNITMENFLIYNDPLKQPQKRWTFTSSVLFAFTILTTIGYGNVAPSTYQCKVFTMIYGAIGIPLFLITIADIGRFSKTGIMYLIKRIFRKEIKKEGEQHVLREVLEVLLVIMILFGFIAAGSAVLPLWESELSYFDSVYFSYMSLTTIGLGDIVPRRMDFLFPTLLYITIGLWLTTAFVEQLADVFRLVHYAGRQVKNVKGISVWLGGRRLSMGTLIQTVCRKVGMSDNLVGQINWDRTMEQALNGEQPPLVPIFPWHFADFVEHDPPLIDVSMDLDDIDQMCGGSFYCSQFHGKGPSLLVPSRKLSRSMAVTAGNKSIFPLVDHSFVQGRRHSVDTPISNGKIIPNGISKN